MNLLGIGFLGEEEEGQDSFVPVVAVIRVYRFRVFIRHFPPIQTILSIQVNS